MNKLELREKRTHGTPEFRFSIEDIFSGEEKTAFSPLHFHTEFEFCVVKKGKMEVQINENYTTLSEGEGLFINSSTLHSILSAEGIQGHMIIVMFDADFILGEKDIIRSKYIEPLINGEVPDSEKLSPEECKSVSRAREVFEEKNSGYELEMKIFALKLISSLLKKPQTSPRKIPGRSVEIIKMTLEYIHKNYKNNITLSEIADYSFVSPEHLCRIFSQFSDVSPFSYLNRYRIMKSAEMLLEDNSPISKIASECGFNSSSYYNKMFLRFIGCTPGEYRKKQ